MSARQWFRWASPNDLVHISSSYFAQEMIGGCRRSIAWSRWNGQVLGMRYCKRCYHARMKLEAEP